MKNLFITKYSDFKSVLVNEHFVAACILGIMFDNSA